ncbi:MAG: hypothetical protein KDD67_10080 [Ignavibacteriae bacterium]|nr:hypothetical protein [Ignavibacteriota bacterium]MCB9216633.1 hypothetical protein [Ignavibacteria bacterium]
MAPPSPRRFHRSVWEVLRNSPFRAVVLATGGTSGDDRGRVGLQEGLAVEARRCKDDQGIYRRRWFPLRYVLGNRHVRCSTCSAEHRYLFRHF